MREIDHLFTDFTDSFEINSCTEHESKVRLFEYRKLEGKVIVQEIKLCCCKCGITLLTKILTPMHEYNENVLDENIKNAVDYFNEYGWVV